MPLLQSGNFFTTNNGHRGNFSMFGICTKFIIYIVWTTNYMYDKSALSGATGHLYVSVYLDHHQLY